MLDFGFYVRGLRAASGWTQEELAKLVGVTDNHISDIENGNRKLSPERYAQFADVFGIDRADFGKMILQHYDPLTYELIFGSPAFSC
jgi:transcriptional regulator with XRE-family HTH domain